MFTQVVRLCRSADTWSDRIRDESGATAVEYSLLPIFIATAIITVVGTPGEQPLPWFEIVMAGL